MTALTALAAKGAPPRTSETPPEWKPRLDIDDATGGFVVTPGRPAGENHSQDDELREMGLDPADWVVTSARRSRWQVWSGEWLEARRINVVPRPANATDHVDIDELSRRIGKWKSPTAAAARSVTGGAFMSPVGDLQLGKPEGGGTPATVARFHAELDRQTARLRRDLGRSGVAETVVLPQLGDVIEGNQSQGGGLPLDMGVTHQVRLYAELLERQIAAYAPMAERVIVPAVPGNHDECSRNSAKVQPFGNGDSWALAAAELVSRIIAAGPHADRVEFLFPPEDDDLVIVSEFGGIPTAMMHGHAARDPLKWWTGAKSGRRPAAKANLLLCAHSHHLRVQDAGGPGELLIQVPAMDGGSTWFTEKTGTASRSRTVSWWQRGGEIIELDRVN